jgi:hypothetical protein
MPRNVHERWQMDLEEYIRQGEPEQSEKSTAWKTDIYNITKSEWVLNGETVLYASADSIRDTLDYDFGLEKQFSYEGLSAVDAVKHIAKFTSGIWQIHPFCEGNTRSTAVFIIKYLKTFGFSVNNEIFAENSWYFRNSLARANYNDLGKGISATTIYLERFFENLLMGYQNELKNRFIHVDYKEQSAIQSAMENSSKCNNCTLEELAILKELQKNPSITQKELAGIIGKSERTIKTRTVEMQEKGLVEVLNPSEYMLEGRPIDASGSAITCLMEGTRPILVEIQALVGTTPYPAPRRVANGVDTGRVLQILAVLEKRIGLNLSKQDVYVNVIGGIDVNEPAADLGIALAIVTCVRDVVFDTQTAIIGELGLSGEIRAVNHIEKRINEAQKLGFKRIIIPDANEVQEKFDGIEIVKVRRILEAITRGVRGVKSDN